MHRVVDRGGPAGRLAGPRGGGTFDALARRFGGQRAGSSPIGGAAAVPAGRGRVLRALAVVLAAVGLWLTGGALVIHAKAALAQLLLQQAWQYTQLTGRPLRPWPWADTRPIARLGVPGRGTDRFVLAGASGRTLAFGPGHHDGSALPGTPGNALLSAHRDTHFRFLRDLAVGELLTIERPDGVEVRYHVRETRVVDRRDLVLPRHAPAPMLTLVTCYPFDVVTTGGPLRYVVVATAE